MIVLEDNQERCPTCQDFDTIEYTSRTLAEETAYAASRVLLPQISQAPLDGTFPGSITSITDASGTRVYEASPLRLPRTVATGLLLNGRSFSSSDTITGNASLTISVSARTTTLTTLSLTAAVGMTPGKYGITFNDVDFNNILEVR